jgi:hypothetical protein
MNQEILRSLEKEAEKQTLDLPCPLDDADYTCIFNENLVKLAIQACMEQVKDFYQEDRFNCYNAAEAIKEHFGVE